jgi:coatomer subunit beta
LRFINPPYSECSVPSLTALTSNPVAVKAAAGKLIELAIREADNNVKLRLRAFLRTSMSGLLRTRRASMVRSSKTPSLRILSMEMVSSKNVEEIIMLLKKELAKTVDEQYEQVGCTVVLINHAGSNFGELDGAGVY